MFTTCLFLWTSAYIVSCSTVYDKACELRDDLLTGYYKDIRPCFGCGTALNINVTFHMTSLNDLDELLSEMITMGYLTVKWIDSRLSWNPAAYGGVLTMMFPYADVWTPGLLVGNPSRKITDLNGELTLVRFFYNGVAVWNPGDIFRTRCHADIYMYPFDEQTCSISLSPWGYEASEITLSVPENDNPTPFYKDNGKWVLDRLRTEYYLESSMSGVEFYFTFKRRPQFFIVNILLPIVLLCFLNCLVFKIPVISGERISYAITVLLSFAVFMSLVGDNIPKTSDPMSLLCYYLFSVFAMSAFIAVCTIFNMRFYHCDPKTPVTPKYKALVRMIDNKFKTKGKVAQEKSVHVKTVSDITNVVTGVGKTTMGENIDNVMLDDDLKPNDNTDITWIDVADSLDKVMMIGYIGLFTITSAVHLLIIYFTA